MPTGVDKGMSSTLPVDDVVRSDIGVVEVLSHPVNERYRMKYKFIYSESHYN